MAMELADGIDLSVLLQSTLPTFADGPIIVLPLATPLLQLSENAAAGVPPYEDVVLLVGSLDLL